MGRGAEGRIARVVMLPDAGSVLTLKDQKFLTAKIAKDSQKAAKDGQIEVKGPT
jgi:hypothetical protein